VNLIGVIVTYRDSTALLKIGILFASGRRKGLTMSTVFRSAVLHVPPAVAWPRLAAVDQIHRIIPAIVSCSLNGDRRECTFADGAQLKERVIAVEAALMRVAYTITDSPFAMEHHHASMQLVPEGAGTRLLWTTDLKPDRLACDLEPLFDQLFGQMTERLGAA
jgi:carbon monoxide dehydrogenase subunit G